MRSSNQTVSTPSQPRFHHEWKKEIPEDPILGLLEVTVKEGKDLPKMDFIGGVDPFVEVYHGLEKCIFSTSVVKKNKNPKWNQKFRILITKSEEGYSLNFNVKDWDRLSKNQQIGTVSIDVKTASQSPGTLIDQWYKLEEKKPRKKPGEIHISLIFKERKTIEREFWVSLAEHYDIDNDKLIEKSELYPIFSSLGSKANDEEISELFETCKDNEKGLSFSRFAEFMCLEEENRERNPILKKIFPKPKSLMSKIWNLSCKLQDDFSIGSSALEGGLLTPHSHKKKEKHDDQEKIIVIDRASGNQIEEKIPDYIKVAMRVMYATSTGRFVVEHEAKRILHHMSEQQGKKYGSESSKKEIEPFINFYSLNEDENLKKKESFKNFNEFFYRELKKSARPIDSPDNGKLAVIGCDSRANVFVTVTEATKLWIKGQKFTIKSLISSNDDEKLAEEYKNCSVVIFRLAPQDYHRFHSPVNATVESITRIDGTYYTVNPIAVRRDVDVYTENVRLRIILNSPEFGKIIYMAVGATLVGSIINTKKVNEKVKKGEELGYFAFGGSTVICLFKENSIKFSDDLLTNSSKPLETLVKVGQPLGTSLL